MEVVCVLLGGKNYRMDHWYFEMHPWLGPCWLRQNGDPRECVTPKGFWDMYKRFEKLTAEEQQLLEVD